MSAMDRMLFIGTLPAEDSEGLVTIARCDGLDEEKARQAIEEVTTQRSKS
jgi:hypothetical protein